MPATKSNYEEILNALALANDKLITANDHDRSLSVGGTVSGRTLRFVFNDGQLIRIELPSGGVLVVRPAAPQ